MSRSLVKLLGVVNDVSNENVMNNDPFKRDFVTLNKSVINYLPRCSYHLLYEYHELYAVHVYLRSIRISLLSSL